MLTDDFDRDGGAIDDIASLINVTHPATANETADFVGVVQNAALCQPLAGSNALTEQPSDLRPYRSGLRSSGRLQFFGEHRRPARQLAAFRVQPIDRDRLGNVLDPVLAHRLEAEGDFGLGVVVDGAGDADLARAGQLLQPRRDVDPIAVDVVLVDDDVTEVDPDPKLDALVLGQIRLTLGDAVWIAAAHSTASTTLANSTSTPSPISLTTRPRCSAIFGSMKSLRSAVRRACVPASSAAIRRL